PLEITQQHGAKCCEHVTVRHCDSILSVVSVVCGVLFVAADEEGRRLLRATTIFRQLQPRPRRVRHSAAIRWSKEFPTRNLKAVRAMVLTPALTPCAVQD